VSNPQTVPSKANLVRFFEDRAEVERTAQVSLGEGPQWVAIDGATALLDDRSVQAGCTQDGVKVLAVKVQRRKRLKRELEGDVLHGLQRQLEELLQKLQANGEQRQRLYDRLNFAQDALEGWAAALSGRHRHEVEIQSWRDTVTALFGLADQAGDEEVKLTDQRNDLNRQVNELRERLRLHDNVTTVYECKVLVQLAARTHTDAEVTLTYRTPCALWRPEHLARLHRHKDKSEVEWTSWGVCWQHTGEDWSEVEVRLSTARPASVADAPLLNDDELNLRKKTAEEKKQVVVEARDQVVAKAQGAAAPEMPGVDDGGKPQEFAPKGRFNLPSDGRPVRVESGRRTLAAKFERVLMPEVSRMAHLRATMKWDSDPPLLAGPLAVAIGASMVGRTLAEFVAPGSEFSVGFGGDDAVRCHRNRQVNSKRARLTGTQTKEYSTTLRLSNLSDTARQLVVTERIPISEIKGLEVEATDIHGWELDKQDGLLTRQVEIPASGTLDLAYHYELTAKSNIQLP
jgi:uncharacterized protein (TIGR02231 family)